MYFGILSIEFDEGFEEKVAHHFASALCHKVGRKYRVTARSEFFENRDGAVLDVKIYVVALNIIAQNLHTTFEKISQFCESEGARIREERVFVEMIDQLEVEGLT